MKGNKHGGFVVKRAVRNSVQHASDFPGRGRDIIPTGGEMVKSKADDGPSDETSYFIGTSGWTYEHWKDHFYPRDLPKSRWLDYYATQFSAVEINATFYGTFKDQTYENWRQRAPQGFGYVLKAPRPITHRKYLVDVEEDIIRFYQSCKLLHEKFEMILLQVAPNMGYDLVKLRTALAAFPDPRRVAVEFRREEWLNPQTESMLREVGAAFCNVDSPKQKLTKILTSTRAYLRLHGRRQWYADNYTPDELDKIADAARELAQRGAERVYIFFNNDFEGYAPANALALKNILEK
jgi:uncharacterized protein YecE (DUF72 family)